MAKSAVAVKKELILEIVKDLKALRKDFDSINAEEIYKDQKWKSAKMKGRISGRSLGKIKR